MTEQNHNTEPEVHEEIPVFDNDVTEANNPIPRWWWAFFATMIGFAVCYFVYYNVLAMGPSLEEELVQDVQQAKLQQEIHDQEQMAKLEATLPPAEIGKKYFKTFCITCHGSEGEGNIGPNFHDNFWIHEPTQESLIGVVTNGVFTKGMPQWGPILGDKKIKALVAYVMTLKDVPLTVPGKASEGKEYKKDEIVALMTGMPATSLAATTITTEKKVELEKTKKGTKLPKTVKQKKLKGTKQ